MKNKQYIFAVSIIALSLVTSGFLGKYLNSKWELISVLHSSNPTQTATETEKQAEDFFVPSDIYEDNDSNYSLQDRFSYEIADMETGIIKVNPNEKFHTNLTIKNTGQSEWYLIEDNIRRLVLATYFPRYRASAFFTPEDNQWSDTNIINLNDTDQKFRITTNKSINAEIPFQAPDFPGAFKESFTPLIKGVKWLNNEVITWDFLVNGDYEESYDFEIEEENISGTNTKNQTKEISLKIKNTGLAPWYTDEPFELKLIPDYETDIGQFIEDDFEAVLREKYVHPGDTGTFLFDITTPEATGTYNIGFKLMVGDIFILDHSTLYFDISLSDKIVALTFDDGYGDLDNLLNILDEQDVKATFFILGVVAQNNPEGMKRIVNEGHLLANHSYSHADFRTIGADTIRWELNTTRDIMKNITGVDPYPYFRYPYGAHTAHTDNVLAQDGWKYFHWTNGTGDFQYHENSYAGRTHIYYYATLNPPDKAIVLMHVISKSTQAALPDIIRWYRDHGYAFVTVDQL